MPGNTDIERTIYKLELDGSEYVKGVESLSASTNKLIQAQEGVNKNLVEAKALQIQYKDELKKVASELKENEKAIVKLAAANKFLQNSSSPEIRKKALDDLTAAKNKTEELKNKTVELGLKLDSVNKSIKSYNKEIADSSKHHNAAAEAVKKFTNINHLAAEAVNHGRRRVVDFGLTLGGGLVGALIGGAIPSIEKLVEGIIELIEVEDKAEEKQKLLNEGLKGFATGTAEATNTVDVMREKFALADQGILNKKDVLEEYNKTIGKTLGYQTDYNKAEEAFIKNASTYIQIVGLKAEAQAIANLKIKESEKKILADLNLEDNRNIPTKFLDRVAAMTTLPLTATTKQIDDRAKQLAKASRDRFNANISQDTKERIDILSEQQRKVEDQIANLELPFKDLSKTAPNKTSTTSKSNIQNIYEQELQKLKADIAKLDEKGFTDEATITKAIEEDFKKRSLAFDKALKNKQLTKDQAASLQSYLKNLQDLTLNAQLKNFREARAVFLQSINDELTNIQIEESTKRISTIQDSAERERQTIISETEKTISAISQKRDKIIQDITKNAAKNGLSPADIAPLINNIKNTYSKLLDDLEVIKNQKLQQLAFDTFERLSEDARRLLDAGNLGVSQGSLINIKEQTELFLQGKISYEKYQKALTEISRFEVKERFNLEKSFLQQEIKLRQVKLENDKTLTDEQIKRLQDEIRKLQQQLADVEKGNATTTAGNKNADDKDDKLANLVKYAQAIGAVADSVIQFWAKANEAETKALDRSIALQEKRVDAAQRIAERGNAQYLKAEEDRLTELNIKRENAARKQLGIDAALQASQILVGVTGAIAKIATPGIGIAETIAAMAVIVGSLAAGYGIVKSLQGNQPHLAEGTTYVQRGNNRPGRDTIPAMLDEGEAVTSARKNKEYHPTIKAIHDGSIPAEKLNSFVRNFHQIKPVPQPNYERIKETAELHIAYDGRMAVLLTENNKKLDEHIQLQRQTIRTLNKMGVNVSLDQRGFAVTQMEVIEQMNRDKKI